jgi:hypothetical protein
MLRTLIVSLLILSRVAANAQFTDTFADGDFTANPAWSGEVPKFEVLNQKLHLNDAAASGEAYLSTPSEAVADATWEAYVEITANPSAANYARLYLMADQDDLSGSLNGYFVRIGGSDDDVCLYRQDGTSLTKVIDGTDDRVDLSLVQLTVQVTRDASGNWQLFTKPVGSPNFISEGTATDEAHTVATHSGVYVEFTTTRKDAFFFDDFTVTGMPQPDDTPPAINGYAVPSATQLQLSWSEDATLASAQRAENYTLLGRTIATVQTPDARTVVLSWNNPLANGSESTLSVRGVTDRAGNVIKDTTFSFTYDITAPVLERIAVQDTTTLLLVFNEALAAPGEKEQYAVNNSIGAPRSVDWLSDSTSVLLGFAASIDNGLANQLWVAGATDRAGNEADTLTSSFRFRTDIDSVWAVSAYQVNVAFATAPSASSEQGENYFLDRAHGTPNVAVRLSDRAVQLIYDRPLEANKTYALQVSNLQTTDRAWLATPVYRFAYDQKAPALDSVVAVDHRTLVAYFSEEMQWEATSSPAAFAVQGVGSPENVVVLPGQRSFRLSLPQDLQPETSYELSVVGLSDRAGNVMGSTKKETFVYDQQAPRLQDWRILSPNRLRLYFHEEVQPASAYPLQHYALGADTNPSHVAVSHLHPEQVTLSFAQPLPDEDTLRIVGVADKYGNQPDVPYDILINNRTPAVGAVVLLSATELRLDFTRTVDAAGMGDPGNYRVGGEVTTRAEVTGPYQSSVVLEWNEPLVTHQTSRLFIQRLADARGTTAEGLEVEVAYDPKVASVTPDGSALTVEFTVPVDASAATNPSHYEVAEVGAPLVALLTDPQSVRLVFATSFAPSAVHALSLRNLLDQDGEVIPASRHAFGQGAAPAYHQLLATEVMADPSPAVGLPEAEYVELHNTTDQLLSLGGLRFSDASTTAVLPTTFLAPQEYVILANEANQQALAPYGRVIAVKSLPSLNSRGDSLRLTNEQGQEIFTLAYADDWYNDAEKRGGGWSLEMVDTQRPCGERDNWTASVNPAGGTPGRPNSVQQANPDRFGPKVVRALVASDTVVRVRFSERLSKSASPEITLSDGLSVREVRWLTGQKEIMVLLHRPIQPGINYALAVRGVTDCSGNLIDEAHASTTFALPEIAQVGDILLSELLVHPRSGGEKFVELYNHSSKPIDLKGWSLANVAEDTLVNVEIIFDDHYVLAPGAYVALTEGPTALRADYPTPPAALLEAVPALPSLPADRGTLVLLDPARTVMQRLDYSDAFHHPLLDDT